MFIAADGESSCISNEQKNTESGANGPKKGLQIQAVNVEENEPDCNDDSSSGESITQLINSAAAKKVMSPDNQFFQPNMPPPHTGGKHFNNFDPKFMHQGQNFFKKGQMGHPPFYNQPPHHYYNANPHMGGPQNQFSKKPYNETPSDIENLEKTDPDQAKNIQERKKREQLERRMKIKQIEDKKELDKLKRSVLTNLTNQIQLLLDFKSRTTEDKVKIIITQRIAKVNTEMKQVNAIKDLDEINSKYGEDMLGSLDVT